MPLAPQTFDACDFGVQWATPEKKTNSERRDMEFPGVSKKSMWNFQELIKNKKEFPRVTKKKQCGIFRGLGFWPWNFQVI